MKHVYKILVLACFFFKFANSMEQLFSLKINLDNLGENISKIPVVPQVSASEKLEQELKKIKSLAKYQEVSKDIQDNIIQESKDKSKKEIGDILVAAVDIAFKKEEHSISLDLRTKINALIDSFSKVKDGQQLKEKIEEIKNFQDRTTKAENLDETTIKTYQDYLNKITDFINTNAISLIKRNELSERVKNILEVLNQFYKGKTFQKESVKKYQDEIKKINQQTNNQSSKLLIDAISQLLKIYALSFPYNTQMEFRNYENLIQFTNALPSNISSIEKVREELRKTRLIDSIKNIRDNDIKRLEQLKQYYEENIKNIQNFAIKGNLEQSVKEYDTIKANIQQKLEKLPEIPMLEEAIKKVKSDMLRPYPNLESVASIASEALSKTVEETEKAKNTLNFLILYYLTPEGDPRLPIIDAISKNEAISTYSNALNIFKKEKDKSDPLIQKYENWHKELKALEAPWPGGGPINHSEYLNKLFGKGKTKALIRDINNTIITNYQFELGKANKITNAKLPIALKSSLNPLMDSIIKKKISQYKDIYRLWQKKYG